MHVRQFIKTRNFFSVPGVSEYITNTITYGKGQNWMKGLDNDDKAFLICKY